MFDKVTHPVAALVFVPLLHHLQPFFSSFYLLLLQLRRRKNAVNSSHLLWLRNMTVREEILITTARVP